MKRIKMLLYGDPGTGKSVFACHAPKPFFITTDGNYEWLEDFGADMNAHIQVSTWAEAKKAFDSNFDGYETIVVDLLEDLFKWCEYEFCKRSRVEHVSDIGYGKGYDISRNEFFLELSKLINKDKHVIFICHGITFTTKDRRGVEHTKYAPSNRIPDKVMDMIEGRLRYVLRCYMQAEEQDNGQVIKKRYLSVVPKECEFGIARGIDETKVPHDIQLDFDEFAKAIGIDVNAKFENTAVVKPAEEAPQEEDKPKRRRGQKQEAEPVEQPAERPTPEQVEEALTPAEADMDKLVKEAAEEAGGKVTPVEEPAPAPAPVEEKKPEPVAEQKPAQPQSNADKIAAIKAKLAAAAARK